MSTCFFLAGCQNSSSERHSQELNLSIHSEPPTLDLRRATDTTSIAILKMCYEGLTSLDSEGKPTLAVAESYEVTQDKKNYIFILKDTYWSDGHPVTAFDFEHTWKTMLAPQFPCEFAYDLYILKNAKLAKTNQASLDEIGVKALDSKRLQIQLEHPIPYLLDLLASHAFLAAPKHITEKHPNFAERAGNKYVVNGPFKLFKWKHYNEISVVKNDKYWNAEKVRLNRINLMMIENENTELSMYENGQLDWAGSPFSTLPIDALPFIEGRPDLHKYDISGTYYFVFNTKSFPFDNINLRRAFALAINRRMIIDNILQGSQIPATGIVPPTMWQDNPPYFADGDLSEARRYFDLALKELGMLKEELPQIILSYNTIQTHHKIAQAIQEQWMKAFGVRVKLQNKEWKVYLDELAHHQFQIARMGGIASFNDPTSFLDFFRYETGANNYSSWTNPEFSRMMQEADETIDEEKRTVLLKSAEKILIDHMPIAPIYFYTGLYLQKTYVKNARVSELNDVDLKFAYLEHE